MNFNLSELYCIEDAITSKRKEWLDMIKENNDSSHDEVTEEFDSIIQEVKKEIKDKEGYNEAFSILINSPRPMGDQ
jgi:hypothetical protein